MARMQGFIPIYPRALIRSRIPCRKATSVRWTGPERQISSLTYTLYLWNGNDGNSSLPWGPYYYLNNATFGIALCDLLIGF